MAVANMGLLSEDAEGKRLCDGPKNDLKNTLYLQAMTIQTKASSAAALSWLRFILPSLDAGQTGKRLGLLLWCGDV